MDGSFEPPEAENEWRSGKFPILPNVAESGRTYVYQVHIDMVFSTKPWSVKPSFPRGF